MRLPTSAPSEITTQAGVLGPAAFSIFPARSLASAALALFFSLFLIPAIQSSTLYAQAFVLRASSYSSLGDPSATIAIGSGEILPGSGQTVVPVYVTSGVDVDSWQMGLDYEDLLLDLIEVSIEGTVSESYAGDVEVTEPGSGQPAEIRVSYPISLGGKSGPLPAGESMHVADLVFELDDRAPRDSTVTSAVAPVSVANFSAQINDFAGPKLVAGAVVIYAGDLLRLGPGSGDAYDPAEVPVRLWFDEAVGELYMGLDYEDVLLVDGGGFDIEGGVLETLSTDEYDISIEESTSGCELRVVLREGSYLPAGSDVLLGVLRFRGEQPFAGIRSIEVRQAYFNATTNVIENLEGAEVEFLDRFVRGDVNFDAKTSLLDCSIMLRYITGAGIPLACEAAADANDDDRVNISDPIFLLSFLFQGGPSPAAPFPTAGEPAVDSSLGCLSEK